MTDIRRIALPLLPVLAFAGLAWLFWQGLSGEPSKLPSALLNKPVPEFSLPPVAGLDRPGLSSGDLAKGNVTIVNIWASWCGPCRDEHPFLMELAKTPGLVLVGINNKDDPENAARFLGTLGNPFSAIGADADGRVTIDWGGYGVPETFVVDGKGVIRYKYIGPLDPDAIKASLLPAIESAKK